MREDLKACIALPPIVNVNSWLFLLHEALIRRESLTSPRRSSGGSVSEFCSRSRCGF